VAVEGFARVLAPAVVAHRRGRYVAWVAGIASFAVVLLVREPPARARDQRIQLRSGCHSGVIQVSLGSALQRMRHVGRDAEVRDGCPSTSYNARYTQAATKRSCAMPRPRPWERNDRLVFERERRGWSQDDAARQADRVADRLGLRSVAFTGQQFGRWERGECRPRPPYLRVVCELYQASAEALGLCDSPPVDRSTPSIDAAKAVLLQPAPLAATGYARETVSSPLGTSHEAEPRAHDQEVKATNRREAIRHAIALGTGVLVGERMLRDAADASVAARRPLNNPR
jgi:transcriptional regulator with XRE-family HTH domain